MRQDQSDTGLRQDGIALLKAIGYSALVTVTFSPLWLLSELPKRGIRTVAFYLFIVSLGFCSSRLVVRKWITWLIIVSVGLLLGVATELNWRAKAYCGTILESVQQSIVTALLFVAVMSIGVLASYVYKGIQKVAAKIETRIARK